MSNWKAYLDDQPERMARLLHLVREGADGAVTVIQHMVMETVPRGAVFPKTDGVLGMVSREETDDFMRAIMEVAWKAGIRPTGFEDHTSELKATRYHLEDMRLLAKVRKPE